MYSGPCRIATEIVVFRQQQDPQSDAISFFSIVRLADCRANHRETINTRKIP